MLTFLLPSSAFKKLGDYIVPTQKIQDDLPIFFRSVDEQSEFHLQSYFSLAMLIKHIYGFIRTSLEVAAWFIILPAIDSKQT